MKLHTPTPRILTFFIITLLPVILPIFTVSKDFSFSWSDFPLSQLYLVLFSLILIIFNPELRKKKENESSEENVITIPIWKKTLLIPMAFILLTGISFLLQKLGNLISKTPAVEFQKPENFIQWLFCSMNFIFSSFYEETVYRFFLPEALIWFTRNVKDRKMAVADCEIVSMILFSLGHIYLGFFSVLNAALAYIILRYCYRKTNSLIPGTAAHFAYNLFQLIVSPF